MSEGAVIPFGKYKGQPVEVLASDRGYCEWLMAQAWFVQRYPQVHTLVINNFAEPTETPEHNALQIRLLDDTFRAQCTEIALRFFDKDRQWTHTVEQWHGYTQMHLVTPFFTTPTVPEFEVDGIDAFWHVAVWKILHTCGQAHPTTLPDRHQSVWEQRAYHGYTHRSIAVECKPLLGDDYPAVLRFLKNLPHQEIGMAHRMVLAGDVRSQTVPLAAIKQFFARSHILLALVDEVEAIDVSAVGGDMAEIDAHGLYMHTPGERCSACLGVEGRQAPYELPLTPEGLWHALAHRLQADRPNWYPWSNLFTRSNRVLHLEAGAVQIGIEKGSFAEQYLQEEQRTISRFAYFYQGFTNL
jgi:hypothetical protein